MTDTRFGELMADPEHGLPPVTQQAVGLWRRGLRLPDPVYRRRIFAVTDGQVTEMDLNAACAARRNELRRGARRRRAHG